MDRKIKIQLKYENYVHQFRYKGNALPEPTEVARGTLGVAGNTV
jgi:hypothetical protein